LCSLTGKNAGSDSQTKGRSLQGIPEDFGEGKKTRKQPKNIVGGQRGLLLSERKLRGKICYKLYPRDSEKNAWAPKSSSKIWMILNFSLFLLFVEGTLCCFKGA